MHQLELQRQQVLSSPGPGRAPGIQSHQGASDHGLGQHVVVQQPEKRPRSEQHSRQQVDRSVPGRRHVSGRRPPPRLQSRDRFPVVGHDHQGLQRQLPMRRAAGPRLLRRIDLLRPDDRRVAPRHGLPYVNSEFFLSCHLPPTPVNTQTPPQQTPKSWNARC